MVSSYTFLFLAASEFAGDTPLEGVPDDVTLVPTPILALTDVAITPSLLVEPGDLAECDFANPEAPLGPEDAGDLPEIDFVRPRVPGGAKILSPPDFERVGVVDLVEPSFLIPFAWNAMVDRPPEAERPDILESPVLALAMPPRTPGAPEAERASVVALPENDLAKPGDTLFLLEEEATFSNLPDVENPTSPDDCISGESASAAWEFLLWAAMAAIAAIPPAAGAEATELVSFLLAIAAIAASPPPDAEGVGETAFFFDAIAAMAAKPPP